MKTLETLTRRTFWTLWSVVVVACVAQAAKSALDSLPYPSYFKLRDLLELGACLALALWALLLGLLARRWLSSNPSLCWTLLGVLFGILGFIYAPEAANLRWRPLGYYEGPLRDILPYQSRRCGYATSAEKSMRTLYDAETHFRKADYDKDGKDFCCNLLDLHDLTDAAGIKIQLISRSLAHGCREGYNFGTLDTYDADGGRDPRFGFAYYAVPTQYALTGRRAYIVNHTDRIYCRDLNGRTPRFWPRHPETEGWTLLGE
jgi:hypothetical protein